MSHESVNFTGCVSIDGCTPDREKWGAPAGTGCSESEQMALSAKRGSNTMQQKSSEPVDRQISRLAIATMKASGCTIREALSVVSKKHPALMELYRATLLPIE